MNLVKCNNLSVLNDIYTNSINVTNALTVDLIETNEGHLRIDAGALCVDFDSEISRLSILGIAEAFLRNHKYCFSLIDEDDGAFLYNSKCYINNDNIFLNGNIVEINGDDTLNLLITGAIKIEITEDLTTFSNPVFFGERVTAEFFDAKFLTKNGVDVVTKSDLVTAEADGLMSKEDKSKLDSLNSNTVTIDTNQEITGQKTFTEHIKNDELDNTNGNAMVRYKSTENKVVLGGSTIETTLMGKGERPTYSNDGSNFEGKPLALYSDIKTIFDEEIGILMEVDY